MPNKIDAILLNDRAILCLSGPDRKSLLQGLITNNVDKIAEGSALYAALLTPQGKYLHDFFITEADATLYLDCERERRADLLRRLMMYRLRADVDITDCSDRFAVLALATAADHPAISYPDPRHKDMGFRAIAPRAEGAVADPDSAAYDRRRLSLGLPDGSRDFEVDRTLILEGNLEELNGVDFEKGCYVGQEVTARMKHRTSLKKRLLPVRVTGPLPDRGTEIINGDGKKIGDLRSANGDLAIGYFRLADMNFGETYRCGDAVVTPVRPDWYPKDQ